MTLHGWKNERSARFTPHELAAIRELKAQHKQSRPAEPTPPNLYNIGDRFCLADGSWKLKKIVGGYMTLEELDALGKAIRKTKKRAPRVIEITEGAFMEHVKRDKDFLARVEAAAENHKADCDDAYAELMCASRHNRIEAPVTSLKVIEAVSVHSQAGIIVGGLFVSGVDLCWFRVQAPAYKLDNVKVALHSIWPDAPITRNNRTLVITVPRHHVTQLREQLRERLATLATAKAA